jgi:sugar/nucleoside kinase (ribokinase family)
VKTPELLVVGSIALDTLETPSGVAENVLGGSSLYFALAASLIRPLRLLAPVGPDAEDQVRRLLAGRQVDPAGLSLVPAPTYRWHARQSLGLNVDLGSRDSIYDHWQPKLPPGFRGWAFLGSMRVEHQLAAAVQLDRAELVAADAMRSYLVSAPASMSRLLEHCHWYFCNQQELVALAGADSDPDACRRRWGLRGICLKRGPGGATIHWEGGTEHVPALAGRPVLDTTGAGDALAGGFLARWLTIGGGPEALAEALVWGVACASLAIEELGLAGLARATPEVLAERVGEVSECWREVHESR